MADSGQKTEKATPQRLKKAREEGKFPSSKDFVAGFQFLIFLFVLSSFGPSWLNALKRAAVQAMNTTAAAQFNEEQLKQLVLDLIRSTAMPIAYAGMILVASGVALQLSSTGISVAWKKLTPSFEHFNPLAKLQNIPKQGVPAVLQAMLLLGLLAGLLYTMIRGNAATFLLMPLGPLELGLQKSRSAILEVLWKAAALFLVFGCFDLFRQVRRFMKQMKMTKQEIRDEMKDSDGNPQIKARIRRLRRDLSRRKMMSEVPTATAVIVNPTHFAVAIKYDHATMDAPVVVAKGKNYLALRIRQIATEHQVPLIENPPLAQALYKHAEVGQHIPPHLYRAIAEVLAYIYKLTRK